MARRVRRQLPVADRILNAARDSYMDGYHDGYCHGYNAGGAIGMSAGRREGLSEAIDMLEAYGAERVVAMLEATVKSIGPTEDPGEPPLPPPERLPIAEDFL